MKVDVTFQCDGTCVECTFGNYNRATAIQATCYDSLVDCLMAGSIRGVGFGTEVRNEIRLFWERCFLDLFFNLCTLLESLIEIYRVGCCQCGREKQGWLLDMWAKVRKVTLLEGRVFGIKCVKFDVFMLLSSEEGV